MSRQYSNNKIDRLSLRVIQDSTGSPCICDEYSGGDFGLKRPQLVRPLIMRSALLLTLLVSSGSHAIIGQQPSQIVPRLANMAAVSAVDDDIDSIPQQDCLDDCDDIDAIANEDAFDEIDDEAVIDDFDDDIDDGGVSQDIKQVPLNAISPQTIETFVEVIDVVRNDFVRPVNDEALFQHAITGMLEKLDSHAEYLTPDNYENLRSFTDGEIGQVGISARFDSSVGEWVVSEVASQSSAKEAGIKVGDRLLRIKRAELTPDMQQQDIKQLLSGIAGSQVQVTISNKRGNQSTLILQRNLSSNNKLEVKVDNSIAVIRLPVFQNGSRNQIIDALRQIDEPITGVVIDVRNNPGGVLSAALEIASLFVADNGLIQVKSRTNHNRVLTPSGTPYLSDLPVVIIQNRYSASAAEVLSSSLKSNKQAQVVGEQSFGKGTVQEVIPLKSGGALKLTVAEYRSINGEVIDGVGIMPDIYYPHDGSDWQQKAISLLLSKDRPVGVKFDNELDGISVIDDY